MFLLAPVCPEPCGFLFFFSIKKIGRGSVLCNVSALSVVMRFYNFFVSFTKKCSTYFFFRLVFMNA